MVFCHCFQHCLVVYIASSESAPAFMQKFSKPAPQKKLLARTPGEFEGTQEISVHWQVILKS